MHKIDISSFAHQKTALVLSGGVAKAAAWHLGVALALEEIGFTLKHNNSDPKAEHQISTYVGSSAGSFINLYFASGIRPIEIIDAHLNRAATRLPPITYKDMFVLNKPNKRAQQSYLYDPLDGLPSFAARLMKPILKFPGIFSTKGLENYILKNVLSSNRFEDYDADLFVVATQLDHSRKVIFSKYIYPSPLSDSTAHYYKDIPVAESVAASMSVPPFYSPYPISNPHTKQTDYYIDGEIRDTLSTHVAVDNKCKYIISSWTHTPYHFHNEIGSLVQYGLPSICIQAIYLLIQKKIVTARSRNQMSKHAIDAVNRYLTDNKFDETHRKKLTSILEEKLDYDPSIKLIDIYPDHSNYKIFFRNSFSLDPNVMSELVTAGYKKTMLVFMRSEWEN